MDSEPAHDERRTRAQYATFESQRSLERRVDALHQSLLGSPDAPGGRIGDLETQMAELPAKMLVAVDQKRRIDRRQFWGDLLKVATGLIAASAGLVVIAPGVARALAAFGRWMGHL